MRLRRAQPVFGPALALTLAVAHGIPAHARTNIHCTDTIFTDGFDGNVRVPGTSAGQGATIALASDGFNFFTLDVHAPESLTVIGSSQGSAFLLAFVDGTFGRAFGLAQDFAVSPELLATIRLSDAAISPIGKTPSHNGNWSGFKQDPVSGQLYAVSGCPSASTLYTIDRNTAAVHTVGNLEGIDCAGTIAIDAHGSMYAIDVVLDELFAVDKSNASTSLIGPLDFNAGMIDMDFAGSDGALYVAGRNNSTQRVEVREVDTQSGTSTLVGVMPVDYITGFAIENEVVCTP